MCEAAVLYGSEACSLGENEIGLLGRAERPTVLAACGVQLKGRKRFNGLRHVFRLKEVDDRLAEANRLDMCRGERMVCHEKCFGS